MVINPIVGVYIPIIRIPGFPIKGGMTIPDIRTLDLYVQFHNWVVETQGFFMFTPILGEMIQFDNHISDGLEPPTSYSRVYINHTCIYNITIVAHPVIMQYCLQYCTLICVKKM